MMLAQRYQRAVGKQRKIIQSSNRRARDRLDATGPSAGSLERLLERPADREPPCADRRPAACSTRFRVTGVCGSPEIPMHSRKDGARAPIASATFVSAVEHCHAHQHQHCTDVPPGRESRCRRGGRPCWRRGGRGRRRSRGAHRFAARIDRVGGTKTFVVIGHQRAGGVL